MTAMPLDWASWLHLLGYTLALSLMAVGRAISTAPDMHRILVAEHSWISDPQFGASIALAQAAPGPNVLFIALLGWNVGLNAAAQAGSSATATWAWALMGAAVCMLGILLPSTTLTLLATRWAHRNRQRRSRRLAALAALAAKRGLRPAGLAHRPAPALAAGRGRLSGGDGLGVAWCGAAASACRKRW